MSTNLDRLNRELAAGHRRAFELEAELARVYARQFRRLARVASARFVELAHPRAITAAAPGTPSEPPGWVPPDVDELLNRPLFDAASAEAARRIHRQALARALPRVRKTPEIALDLESPFAEPLLEKVATKSVNMGLAARDVIVKIIGDAYSQGLSVPNTAAELRAGIDHLSQTTALMQARTDLNGLANGASLASVQTLGDAAPGFKEWLATDDERTRDTHVEANGQTVPIDQPFSVGDDSLMYPGDPAGSDAEVINCRCTIVYTDSQGNETGGDEMDITAAASSSLPLSERDRAWDAAAAKARVAKWASSDGSGDKDTIDWAQYGRAFFYVDPAARDQIGGYHFPFADVIDGTLTAVWRGVTAAAQRLSSSDIPDKDAVKSKIRGYYAKARDKYDDPSIEAPFALDVDELLAAAAAGDVFDNMLEALLAAALSGAPVRWRAVLAREGEITADGRVIDPGALTWRPLPLTLMAMIVNSESGHTGSEVAGRIDRIYRAGFDIIGEGVFDVGEYGSTIAELVRTRTLRGVSVDIAPEEIEFRPKPGAVQEYDDDGEPFDLPEIMAVTKGLLLGATVCPFQAIGSATIEVITAAGVPLVLRFTQALELAMPGPAMPMPGEAPGDEPDDAEPDADPDDLFGGCAVLLYPASEEAAQIALPDGEPADSLHVTLAYCPGASPSDLAPVVAEMAARCEMLTGNVTGVGNFDASGAGGDGHPCFAIPNVPGLAALRTDLVRALDDAGVPVATDYDFVPHITLGYSTMGPMMPPHAGRVGCDLTFDALTLSSKSGDQRRYPLGLAPVELTAAAAGLAPVRPPREWFENPRLEGPTPLTVTDDGRVFGHVAVFNQCHIGNPAGPGICVTAPKSPTGYSNFHLGELVTAEGDAIAVGQLTIDTGHAPLGTTPRQAVAHYDNTGTVAAHVRCGEDRFGIWFAGAVSPDVSESMLRKFRGSKISGDWRKVNGRVDMIGAHCVNIPGFPIPRPAARIVASAALDGELDGGLLALVAAGIVGEAPRTPEQIAARIATLAARAEGIDALVAAGLGEDHSNGR